MNDAHLDNIELRLAACRHLPWKYSGGYLFASMSKTEHDNLHFEVMDELEANGVLKKHEVATLIHRSQRETGQPSLPKELEDKIADRLAMKRCKMIAGGCLDKDEASFIVHAPADMEALLIAYRAAKSDRDSMERQRDDAVSQLVDAQKKLREVEARHEALLRSLCVVKDMLP